MMTMFGFWYQNDSQLTALDSWFYQEVIALQVLDYMLTCFTGILHRLHNNNDLENGLKILQHYLKY